MIPLNYQSGGTALPSKVQPLVSVIIVNWNARAYLEQCLESLSESACCHPMEVIVVDNASSDGSTEAVVRRFPYVHLLRNSENVGFARGNNLGIAASTGRYLCLVNSDVRLLPGCIDRLIEYCENHPEVGMVGPKAFNADGTVQRTCRGTPGLWNMLCRALALDRLFPSCTVFTGYQLRHWDQGCLRPVDILGGWFWLVRRQAVKQVGLLDEDFFMYAEDMDWCKRFRQQGWQLVFVPSAQAIHYGGGSSSNAPIRFQIELYRGDLQYWVKHRSRLAVIGFFLICCLHLLSRVIGHSLIFIIYSGQRAGVAEKVRCNIACLKWLLFESRL